MTVTAETAPHYFSLDHRAVEEYNTCAKMNPPLREPDDVEAIKNSPFIGWRMKGTNVMTMVGGRIVWERDL
jgi:dihydroorotase-like cyclic amidohydrolase